MPRPRSQKAIIKDVAALVEAGFLDECNQGRFNSMAKVLKQILDGAGLIIVEKPTEGEG